MANILARFAGKLCEVFLPVKHDIFAGNEISGVAVCTLSSIGLLERIARSELMNDIALAGRMFSENTGIATMIRYVLQHPNLHHIILCGKDTKGHLPGQALLALHRNGIDSNYKIIGALGKDPVLEGLTETEVNKFRQRISLVDLIGVTDIDEIYNKIKSL